MRRKFHPGKTIHRLLPHLPRLRTPKARKTHLPPVPKVPHVVIPLHLPALEAHPPAPPRAPPLRLAVLEPRGLPERHAPRAGEAHGRCRAAGANFEGVVEAAPGAFAERGGGAGGGVEVAACEAEVGDGRGGEVGGCLREEFGGEAVEGRGRGAHFGWCGLWGRWLLCGERGACCWMGVVEVLGWRWGFVVGGGLWGCWRVEVSRGIPGKGDMEVWKERRGADGVDVFVGT